MKDIFSVCGQLKLTGRSLYELENGSWKHYGIAPMGCNRPSVAKDEIDNPEEPQCKRPLSATEARKLYAMKSAPDWATVGAE